jgi:thiamine-monophosphate kinase
VPTEASPRTVGALGEFALIARLLARVPPGGGLLVGAGDDAAVLALTPGTALVATCDGQVENVHFRRDGTPPRALGHKALAVNLSDVAAMGGRPRWALVALTLPTDLEVGWLDGLYDGMAALAHRHGVGVVGGNVARTAGPIVVDVTLLGEVRPDERLTRAGARPGDAVFVTGAPGESAAGLRLILEPVHRRSLRSEDAESLLGRHRAPAPRVDEGQRLARSGCVTAAIDVSDGLAADLGHVLAASNVGATLDAAALPVSPPLRRLAEAVRLDPIELVLHGGEDYELLFTGDPERAEGIAGELGVASTRIGTIDREPGLRLRGRDGVARPLTARGHDHFAPGANRP